MKRSIFHWWPVVWAVALLINSTPAQAKLLLQSDQTLQQCSQVDEAALQDELNTVTQQVFAKALAAVDLNAIVDTQWARLGIDRVIDSEVDAAVARVKGEEALWDTFLSGWSADKAAELTRAVATYAFQSEAFGTKMDELSSAVATELSQQIAVLSAESVSAAFYCLRTFISDNYANVLLHKFEQQVQSAAQGVDVGAAKELDTSILTVLDQHKTALGGIGVIIAAQIARRILVNIGSEIAERVAGRIVGRVLGRIGSEIIPIVGWLVGTGLIAYDLYNSREGALPQIQGQLKSSEVKAAIRGEMVAAMEPEFRRETPQIARDVANELFSQWRDVRRSIRQVLELSDDDPAFRTLLNELENTDDLSKLVKLVGVAVPALGQDGFHQAVADGSVGQLLRQPASALQIVAETKSMTTALAWSALAGERLDEVVSFELYKHLAPEQFTRPLLDRLLALNDRIAVEKLALLDRSDIEALLTISTNNLKTLAGTLTAEELGVVAGYLPLLNQEQKNQLVSRLTGNPALVAMLASEGVKEQIIASKNVDAALTFLGGPRDFSSLSTDLAALIGRRVELGLFVYKYGAGQSTLIAAGLVLLALVLLRLLFALGVWLVRPLSPLWKR